MAEKALELMRTGSADFHQGSLKPDICLQLFCQLSLIRNKKVDATRCPYKLFRKKTVKNKAAHKPSLIFEKPSTKDKIEQIKATIQIGFGLESKVKLSRVKRVDVHLDDKTKPVRSSDKSIIYTAGWSLKDTEGS